MDFLNSGKKQAAKKVVEDVRAILALDPQDRESLRSYGVNIYSEDCEALPPVWELDSIVLGKNQWHLIFKSEVNGRQFQEDPRPFLSISPFVRMHSGNYGGFQFNMPLYNSAPLQQLGKYVCQLLGPEFDCFEHWQVQNSAGCDYTSATYYVKDEASSAAQRVTVTSYGGGYVPPYAFCVVARKEIVAARKKYRNKSAEAAKKAAHKAAWEKR